MDIKNIRAQHALRALRGIQEAARDAEAVAQECPETAPFLLSTVLQNIERYRWFAQDAEDDAEHQLSMIEEVSS